MTSLFQSFDASYLGAFQETRLHARNPQEGVHEFISLAPATYTAYALWALHSIAAYEDAAHTGLWNKVSPDGVEVRDESNYQYVSSPVPGYLNSRDVAESTSYRRIERYYTTNPLHPYLGTPLHEVTEDVGGGVLSFQCGALGYFDAFVHPFTTPLGEDTHSFRSGYDNYGYAVARSVFAWSIVPAYAGRIISASLRLYSASQQTYQDGSPVALYPPNNRINEAYASAHSVLLVDATARTTWGQVLSAPLLDSRTCYDWAVNHGSPNPLTIALDPVVLNACATHEIPFHIGIFCSNDANGTPLDLGSFPGIASNSDIATGFWYYYLVSRVIVNLQILSFIIELSPA